MIMVLNTHIFKGTLNAFKEFHANIRETHNRSSI